VEEWRNAVNRWADAILRILEIYSRRGAISDEGELAAEEIVDSVLGAYLDALLPAASMSSPTASPAAASSSRWRSASATPSTACAAKPAALFRRTLSRPAASPA
jgi:hypothetical protein